jgi:hypothetical protein
MDKVFDVEKFDIRELETIEAPMSSEEVAGFVAGAATTAAVAAAAAVLAD